VVSILNKKYKGYRRKQEFLRIISFAGLVLDDIICRLISKHNLKKKMLMKKFSHWTMKCR